MDEAMIQLAREFFTLRQRAEAAEQKLAEYTENRQVGTCVDCGAAIWFRQERMEDETGMYHPLCRAVKVARTQGMREAAEIARNPYSDQVKVIGPEEPLAVGAKIAAAIEQAILDNKS